MARTVNPEEKTWDEFRAYGLLTFVNQFLHLFGWVIVIEYDDDGNFVKAYPARTSWRGFPVETMTRAYRNLTRSMAKDMPDLLEDVKEGEEDAKE